MTSEPPKTDAGTVESGQPSTQNAENATKGTTTADPNKAATVSPNAAASASGDVGPPVDLPAFAAQRQVLQERAQAEQPKTPLASATAAADEAKKTDFASMSSVDCAKKVILEATKEAVVASALALHGGDSKAVAVTVAEALEGVLQKIFFLALQRKSPQR